MSLVPGGGLDGGQHRIKSLRCTWSFDSSHTLVFPTQSNSSLGGGFTPVAYSGAACEARRRRCIPLAYPKCRPLHCGNIVLLWFLGRVRVAAAQQL